MSTIEERAKDALARTGHCSVDIVLKALHDAGLAIVDMYGAYDGERGQKIHFRAGLLAAREAIARTHGPLHAACIRSFWWPSLGDDPGEPRQLRLDERGYELMALHLAWSFIGANAMVPMPIQTPLANEALTISDKEWEDLTKWHGWVRPSPDGAIAKCGGEGICQRCKLERFIVDVAANCSI